MTPREQLQERIEVNWPSTCCVNGLPTVAEIIQANATVNGIAIDDDAIIAAIQAQTTSINTTINAAADRIVAAIEATPTV